MPWKPHTALWEVPLVTARGQIIHHLPATYICNAPASLGDKKLQIPVQSWFMTWYLTNKHRILPFLRWTFPLNHSPQLISCTAFGNRLCVCLLLTIMHDDCHLPHRQMSKAVLRRTWLLGFPHSETRLHIYRSWSCIEEENPAPTVSIYNYTTVYICWSNPNLVILT